MKRSSASWGKDVTSIGFMLWLTLATLVPIVLEAAARPRLGA